jgi:Restriction Enzyme Adenine Methylase Associated
LLNAGLVQAGMTLIPRRKQYENRIATLLPNGHLEVDGSSFPTPSVAAAAIRGKPTGGWWFFLVDQAAKRSLRDVRRDYVEKLDVEVEDDDGDEDEDDK